MHETGTFTVDFDRRAAWSILYSDGHGQFIFVFEPDLADTTHKTVNLESHPISGEYKHIQRTAANAERLDLARDRVARFLESCTYIVHIEPNSQ